MIIILELNEIYNNGKKKRPILIPLDNIGLIQPDGPTSLVWIRHNIGKLHNPIRTEETFEEIKKLIGQA